MVPFRRFPLVALASIALLFGCRSARTTSDPCSGGGPGNPDPNSPIVCVAIQNGLATPLIDPVHVYNKGKGGGSTNIHWKTAEKNADLQVQMTDTNQTCVKSVNCDHNGNNCVAIINKSATPGSSCSYQVWVDGVTRPADPIIIIDPCCTN